MNGDTKKKIFIALGVGAAIFAGIFIYEKLDNDRRIKQAAKKAEEEERKRRQEAQRKLQRIIKRHIMIDILKKARKQNFKLLKKIAALAIQIASKMNVSRVEPLMVKSVIESTESPLKVEEQFAKVYEQACKHFNVTHEHFAESLEHYASLPDVQINILVDQIEKDYELSLSGKLPQTKISVPVQITKEKILEVYNQIALKKHLIMIENFRKTRGKTQQQLMANEQLLKSITKPEDQQLKILQDAGFGAYDASPEQMYIASLKHYKADHQIRTELLKVDSHYAEIFNRYRTKIQSNRITQNELNQLQDQLIYAWSV